MNYYDPKKQSTFISYLDMNNLYGWTMSQYPLYEGFKWLKNNDKFDVMSINEKSSIGYFLEVDLEILINYINYTMIIHQLQKNLLFLVICCRNIVKKITDKYELKVGDVKKSIPNLGNKTNYV